MHVIGTYEGFLLLLLLIYKINTSLEKKYVKEALGLNIDLRELYLISHLNIFLNKFRIQTTSFLSFLTETVCSSHKPTQDAIIRSDPWFDTGKTRMRTK